MKKISLYLLLTLGCIAAYASVVRPLTVQGIDYRATVEETYPQQPAAAANYQNPVSRMNSVQAGFSFEDIKSWAGDGLSEAALVIQWNNSAETNAKVFGYRFNGEVTGADMLKAIVEEYPYLYAMVQETDLGYTLNGFGYDNVKTGNFKIKVGNDEYTLEPDKLFINPTGSYNYDDFTVVNPLNYWASGWYQNYWSYWVGDSEGNLSYSNFGMSNHNVADGAWYGWNFIPVGGGSGDGEQDVNWKNFEAAEVYNANPLTEVTYDGIRYQITNRNLNTVAVVQNGTSFYNVTGELTIPSTFVVDGVTYTVTRVNEKAFYLCRASKITLPETVYYIGDNAFQNTQLMTSLVIPGKLYGMGEMIFNCAYSLPAPIYPEGFDYVPAKQFLGCLFTDINLPESIKRIGESAFFGCDDIESLTFDEKHAPYIEAQAFGNCKGLKTVTVTLSTPFEIDENAFVDINSGATTATLIVPKGSKDAYANAPGWNKFSTIEDTYVEIEPGTVFETGGLKYRIEEGNTAVVVPSNPKAATYAAIKTANLTGYTGEIEVPATVTYQGATFKVTGIEPMALAGSGITKLTIADGITLGHHAVAESRRLTEVVLPADIKSLPYYSFYYCSSLANVNLPEGLVEIGCNCFSNTKVNTVVPSTVTEIGGYAFGASAMTEFIQPAGLKAIPDSLFMDCKTMTKAVFNDGTTLGESVLRQCAALTEVRLPADLEVLPKYTVYMCRQLKSVELPSTLTTIQAQALSYIGVESLTLPETVKEIGSFAFLGNSNLKKISFPESITVIPQGACGGCSSMEEVVLSDNVTEIGISAFGGRFYPCPALKKITILGDESGESRLPSKLEIIGTEAFRGDKVLEVAMSPAIRELGEKAFYECALMEDFTLPNIEKIGHEVFRGTAIKTFVFPESTKEIGSPLFFQCPIKDDLIYTCANPQKNINKSMSSMRPLSKGYGGSLPYPSFKLVVPTGHVNDVNIISGWGDGVEFVEPVLKGQAFGENCVEVDGNNVNFTNAFQVTYDLTDMPEIFTKYNNRETFRNYTFQVWYKPKGSAEVVKSIEAVYDGENLTASIEGLAPGEYEYFWRYRRGQIPTLSETAYFTIERPDPGFNVTVAGAEQENGVYVLGVNKTYKINVELTSAESVTYTLADNQNAVATFNKYSTSVITKAKEGTFSLVVADANNPENSETLRFEVRINKHVESITLEGLEDGVLKVKYNTLQAVNPVILPADADITDFTITIDDPTMAKIYAAKAFNPTRNFYELSTFKTGETNVTYTAADGSGVEFKFRLVVEDRDREGEIDYTKGVFWLNEEWFGHNNGSINFIDDEYNVTYKAYERENPWQSFGATSQFATVYGGKLFVMSKQGKDGGDPREAGGRLVIADAKTLKTIATFKEIGGDGRACVGVAPDKVYLGHTAGIRVLHIDGDNYTLADSDIEGITGKNAYSGQIGDMVKAGKYVFAIQQSTGLHIIDTETDRLVKTIAETAVAGVVQSADGNVWVAAAKKLYCYDPETLELIDTKEIAQSITGNWGAWKSTNFKAAKKENVLFWGGASIYRWEIGKELPAEPVFALGSREGMNGSKQAQYGTIGYDDVTDQLIIATTHGSSSNYRYNWYYFIDAKTGEINNTQAINNYYWFPAMPVVVDRYDAEINVDDISLEMEGEAYVADLAELVTDADDIDGNINITLTATPDAIAETSLEGRTLTVAPKAEGEGELVIAAESRGKVVSKTIAVNVEPKAGISGITAGGNIIVKGRTITVKGLAGEEFRLYDMSGRLAAMFVAESDNHSVEVAVPAGVYLLRGASHNVKAVIR